MAPAADDAPRSADQGQAPPRVPLAAVDNAWLRMDDATNLMHVHGAERVTLYGLTRELPTTQAVLAGVRLDDPRYLIEERLDTYSAETGEVVESISAAEELKR